MHQDLPELRVVVRRGSLVESTHRVHAVRVREGKVAESWGDPELVTFMRSAAKPLQAVLLVRAYDDLSSEEIAIASASHGARPEQLAAVRALLSRAGAVEDDLECGPVDGSRLRHNCSGKHAAMLCVCAARGWPRAGYRLAGHPLQVEIGALVAEAAGLDRESIPTATDGCGVVTFALALVRMALVFSRLVEGDLDGSVPVREAMRAHPELIEGPGWAATEVMRALPGAVAKGGAEGIFCAGLPSGDAVALKVEDGAMRATRAAAGLVLGLSGLVDEPLRNSRGEEVGKIHPSTFPQQL